MKYCVNLPIGGPAAHPRTLAGFAAAAEDAGWGGVFVEDYIVYQTRQDLPAYDPWVALAAMAAATSRVRLGTMATPVARSRAYAPCAEPLAGARRVIGNRAWGRVWRWERRVRLPFRRGTRRCPARCQLA